MRLSSKIKLLFLCLLMVVTSFTFVACKTNNGGGNGDGDDVVYADPITLDKYVNDTIENPVITYDNKITVDGNIDEDEWATQDKFILTMNVGGIPHDIEASAYFAEEGLIMYWQVLGAPAYYNSGRASHDNSGVEVYLAPGTAQTINGNAWELDFQAGNAYASKKNIGYHKNSDDSTISYGYATCAAYFDFDVIVDGELNDASNNGYSMEYMIPWTHLGFVNGMPEYVCVDGAIINCTSEVGNRNAWVSIAQNNRSDYSWANPQGWYKFTKTGYVDENVFNGEWKVLSIDKSVTISADAKDVTKTGVGKANNNNKILYNADVVGASYQEAVFYNPIYALYENNIEMIDYVQTKDLGLGGLIITSAQGEITWAMHVDKNAYKVRWQSGNWQGPALTAEQLANYNNPNKGLRIGLLNVGSVCYGYIEDNGVMKLASSNSSYDVSGKGIVDGAHLQVGLQTNIDLKVTDYSLFYGDDIATIPYVINDGDAVVGGSVTVTGSIIDGATVMVTADDGYELSELIINGEDINAMMYNVPAFSVPKLNIEVSFVQSTVEKNLVTLNIAKNDIFGENAGAYEGYVNFASDYSAVGIADADGNVTVKLADGSYLVSAVGYKAVAITVADGVASVEEVVLSKNLFIDNNSWTVTANNDGSYNVTSIDDDNGHAKNLVFAIDPTSDELKGGFALDLTFETRISNSSKFFPGIFLTGESSNSFFWSQFSAWGVNVDYKLAGVGVAWARVHSDGGMVSLKARFIISQEYVTLCLYRGGQYMVIDNLRENGLSKFTQLSFNYCNDYTTETPEDWMFKNVKISKLDPATVTVLDIDNATVTVDKEKVNYSDRVNITLELDEVPDGQDPYTVYDLTVNGQSIDYVVNGTTVTASFVSKEFLSGGEYVIDADVRQASLNNMTVAVKGGIIYNSVESLADGTVVSYVGLKAGTATVADGNITLDIFDGEYIFSAPGYIATTVIVDGDTFTELVLAKPIIGGNPTGITYEGGDFDLTYSAEKGYSITSTRDRTFSAFTPGFDVTEGFEFSCVANFKTISTSKFYPTFRLHDSDGNISVIQFCVWNGTILLKNLGLNETVTLQSGAGTMSKQITYRVEKIAGVVTIIVSSDGQELKRWTGVSSTVPSMDDFEIAGFFFNYDTPLSPSEYWSLDNIQIKPLTNA